jgi:uncharacterized protein HemX
MNWFLLFIILVMAGGGYYEYQTLHGQVTVDQMQISDFKKQLQAAADGEQKSADDVMQLTTNLTDAQAKASDLEKQLQTAKTALAAAQPSAPTGSSASSSTTLASTAPPPAFTTKLGTITALDGKIYAACQLLKINADSIVISNADGITQVSLNVLPTPVQRMFGYDNTQGKLSDDQVQLLEQKRQAAAASGN